MNNGSYIKIDARTSDAVALAIRCNCPIYTTEQIIEKAGIVFNVTEEQAEPAQKEPQPAETGADKYEKLDIKELKKLLDKSISNEDYEEASHIRDEIQRREGK